MGKVECGKNAFFFNSSIVGRWNKEKLIYQCTHEFSKDFFLMISIHKRCF